MSLEDKYLRVLLLGGVIAENIKALSLSLVEHFIHLHIYKFVVFSLVLHFRFK
jgi:hypothetical protein